MADIDVCNPQRKMQDKFKKMVKFVILSGQNSVRSIFIYGGCTLNTDRTKSHET